MDEAPDRPPLARGLISGTIVLFGARLTAAGLGLFQVILLATKFGASTSTDAYFVASAACLLFIGPIESALNMAFVPVFVHTAETEGESAAWRIGAGLFRIGLFGAGGVTLVLAGVAPWLAALLVPGLDEATTAEVAQLIQIMAPVILFTYPAAFLSNLEYIAGRYRLPATGMVLSALAGPLALLLFADRFGVQSLAWGALAGAVARCLLLSRLQAVTRLLGPALAARDPAMRRLGRVIVSRLLTTSFFMVDLMVDRAFASLLGPGFISALAYASRAVTTVVRLFMIPMGRVLLPPLTRLAARERYERMRGVLERLVIGLVFLVVPLVAFMVAFRTELLGIVFQRGAFDAAAVDATAEALLFFTLGIIPFLMTPLLTATFFALQDSSTPLRVGLACVATNACLDALLVFQLGHGGIALATSLVAAIRTAVLWIYLGRRIGSLKARPVLGSLAISAATAAVAFWCVRLLVPLTGLGWLEGLWWLAACGVIGGAGYLLLQALLNRPVVRLIPAVLGRLGAERS